MRIFKSYLIKTIKKMMLVFMMITVATRLCAGQASKVALPKTGSARTAFLKEKALFREREAQKKEAGIDPRPLKEVEDAPDSRSMFGQTEAYFQVPGFRELVSQKWNIVPYMNIISQVSANEARFMDKNWAFYHTTSNVWRVPQDLYTQLYKELKAPNQKIDEDFTFLRFGDEAGPAAEQFLINELGENGLVDDNGAAGNILLSANLSLFGNTGFPSESTWRYFMKEKNHKVPERKTYEQMMDKFGLTHNYIEELMSLVDMLNTQEQTLVQIFVPKNIIDDIGYLSWATGIPAHEETINWVKTNIKNRTFKGKAGKPGALWAIAALGDTFKKEQEKNPIFKDLLKSVKEGDYSLDAYLKVYTNKPSDLPNMDYVQARLIFNQDVLLNPDSGVKMFRYTTVSRETMQEYSKKLTEIVKKILSEKR